MRKIVQINLFVLVVIICYSLFSNILKAQAVAYLESVETNKEPHSGLLVTPDGKYIIKSYYYEDVDKRLVVSVFVFDVKTFRMIKSFTLPGNDIPFRLTENGKTLIYAAKNAGIITYKYIDVITGKVINEIFPFIQEWAKDIIHDSTFLSADLQLYTGQKKFMQARDLKESVPKEEGNTRFCNHGSNILTIDGDKVYLWDLISTAPIDVYDCGSKLTDLKVAPNSMNFAVCSKILKVEKTGKDRKSKSFYFTIENGKIKYLTTFNSTFHDICFSRDYIYLVDKTNIKKYRVRDGELLFETQTKDYIVGHAIYFSSAGYSVALDLQLIEKLPGTEYLLITDMQNLTQIFSTKANTTVAYIYTWGEKDYAFVTPDGRMEGTKGAIDHLRWVGSYNKIPLANTYDQMYTPSLMTQVFANTLEANKVNLDDLVKFSPEIKITSPSPDYKATSATLQITCSLKDNGDEIKQVRIYINDKLVSDETRGMKAVGPGVNYSVTLLPGSNTVKAVAISKNGYQSAPAEVHVSYTGTVAESRLFVLAVGIDKYKNSSYNLNYAVADASSIVDKINSSSKDIFRSIHVCYYKNEQAIRDSILAGFNRITNQSKPQDAFLLFYAGHGVMSEGSPDIPKDFFLALSDVTQLYGKDELLREKGISALELRELSKKVPAQKQVLLLDACQSGAAGKTFAMRGAAEEKAVLQLARSTGSYLIASTGSEQYATEFKELGHGVFTYALLQGLSCKAPASQYNSKVTIKDLESYLNDYIPELTEKYHGSSQYPKSWSKGMDFPLTLCK